MLPRSAFVAGWIFGWWHHRPPPDLGSETAALKEEIKKAFDLIQEIREVRASCEWDLWWQGWVLRFNWLFELGLLIFLLWLWRPWARAQAPQPPLSLAEFEDSSDSDDTPIRGPSSTTPYPEIHSRKPSRGITRPSDLIRN